MKIKAERHISCRFCHKAIVLYEYEGLEGGWYSDHFCQEESDYLLREAHKVDPAKKASQCSG